MLYIPVIDGKESESAADTIYEKSCIELSDEAFNSPAMTKYERLKPT